MNTSLSALAFLVGVSVFTGCTSQAQSEEEHSTSTQTQAIVNSSSPGWQVREQNEPSARGAAQGASADMDQTQALLFGGLDGELNLLGDTHLYGENGWLEGDRTGEQSPRPSSRAYGALGYLKGPLHALFGGFDVDGARNDLWMVRVSADERVEWTQVQGQDGAAQPAPRFLHGVAVWQGELLVFGGVNNAGMPLRDMWKATVGGTEEAPTVNWSRLCEQCVPGLYGAAALQVQHTGRDGVFMAGGYGAKGLTDAVYRWNESLTEPAWIPQQLAGAIVPTQDNGRPVLDTVAKAPESRPMPRYVAHLSHDAEGNLLYGGGVDLNEGDFHWISDAWILDRRDDSARWSRLGLTPQSFLPGGRESPLALPLYKNGASAGMLFFGGNRDGKVLQQTRTTDAVLSAESQVKVHATSHRGVTSYRMSAMNNGVNIVGYGVYRQGGVWKLGEECGSPDAPLVTAPGSCILATVDSGEPQPDAFAWLFRDDRNFYNAETGEPGALCLGGSPQEETCNARFAFPGQVEARLSERGCN